MEYRPEWNRVPEGERGYGDPESLRTSRIEAVLRVEFYQWPHGTPEYRVRCLLENGEVVEVGREDVEKLGSEGVPGYNKRVIEGMIEGYIKRQNPEGHLPPLS